MDAVELVACAMDVRAAVDEFEHLPGFDRPPESLGDGHLRMVHGDAAVDIRFSLPDTAGSVLLRLTGTAAHLSALTSLGELPHAAATEEDIYAALNLPWIPAEIRQGGDEIQAAQAGRLSPLVSRADIRGDLHLHTTWSDGRDSVGDMVRAAAALGYEYVAITDHSASSAASRNLSRDDIPRQADEIARLRDHYPRLTILHGCEVDILRDGRLDFDDEALARFDIVLASLHDRADHSPEELLGRYLGAMRHPLVSVITHPANRLYPVRPAYDLDYDRLFAAAADTGTAVEIDGSPSHLDLDGPLARRAIGAGATVVIDSDCHMSDMLSRQMDLGVLLARRGWVEPRHVLNAKPIDEVRRFIAAKRAR